MSQKWNPMEDDYRNSKFNKYEDGPGADLDEDLQPGAVASSSGKQTHRYTLFLNNVPKYMTEKALRTFLLNFGKILNITRRLNCSFAHVDFPTLNDMERTLTGLKGNSFNIIASPAKSSVKREESEKKNENNFSRNLKEGEEEVDLSRRTIKGPFTFPLRLKFQRPKPFVTEEEHENSKLKESDPYKHFLVEYDMHGPSRNNPRQSEHPSIGNNRCIYTGRSYYVDMEETIDGLRNNIHGIVAEQAKSKPKEENSDGNARNHTGNNMQHQSESNVSRFNNTQKTGSARFGPRIMPTSVEPKETTDKLKKLANSSQGKYDISKSEYIRQSNDKPEECKCVLCGKFANKICQRCEAFYCSLDCQKADWQQHRSNCFKMPALLDAPKSSNNEDKNKTLYNRNSIDYKSPQNDENRNNKPRELNQSSNYSFENKVTKPSPSNEKENRNSRDIVNKQIGREVVEPKKIEEKKKGSQIECVEYPPNGALVAITAVLKPNHMYIRSLKQSDNLEYVKILNIVNNESKKSEPLKTLPKRGDLTVAKFSGTEFYRALVINAESKDKISVAYIDFGNIDIKKLSELRECPAEALKFKRYSLPMRLKNVPDFEPTDSVTDYLQSFVDAIGKDLKVVYEPSDKNGKLLEGGDLIDVSTNESLSKKIMQLKVIKPPAMMDDPVMSKDIEVKLLPEGENVTVVVFDNSFIENGYISCIHENDLGSLDKLNTVLKDYADSHHEPYTPRVSELCIVQFEDGEWYRAECIEVAGDGKPSVMFIDFGNLAYASISKIRKYPRELIQPCYTSSCLISGLPDQLNEKLTARIKELVQVNEKIVLDKVVPVESESINTIDLYGVTSKLKAEGLI